MGMFGRKRKMMGDPNTAENIDLYREQQGMSAPEKRTGPNWGEIGRNVLGNIGDAVSIHYGGAPTFGPLQRQALAFQQQGQLLAERQRQQAALQAQRAADQMALAEYRSTLPTAMERNLITYEGWGPERRALYHEMKPEYRQGPDGRFYRVQTAAPTPSVPPTAPVGKLRPLKR